ncbi:MAG: SPOR domain-containing protein [Xanthomonadales bacterium]|nr:SPOR domain-containing protein [Xanthomonadales bacterium]
MIARGLLFLALLANLAYYGWHTRGGRITEPPARSSSPPPPAHLPELVLLEERERELLEQGEVRLGRSGGPVSNCFTLGPFSNQADLRRAFNAIAPHIEKSRQRQTVETVDRGFWVYLPAVPTREDALRVARDLNAAGLRDYYVVTAGEQENTIALGLFRQEENARRRLAALKSLGFEDAEMDRRSEETLSYWLDYARLPDAAPPWERIVASGSGMEHRPIPCFR